LNRFLNLAGNAGQSALPARNTSRRFAYRALLARHGPRKVPPIIAKSAIHEGIK
jgi:hypothetical protein